MKKNDSRVVFGVTFIVLGVYVFLDKIFEYNLWEGLPFLLGSLILFWFYYSTQKTWIGLIATIMAYVGLKDIVPNISVIGPYLEDSFAFLIPGIILFGAYFTKKKSGYLIWGSVLFWIGVSRVLKEFSQFQDTSNAVFYICLGLAFMTIYLVKLRQWTLVPAAILIILGGWDMALYHYKEKFEDINLSAVLLAVLLIVFGIGILLDNNDSKKIEENDEIEDDIMDTLEYEEQNIDMKDEGKEEDKKA